MVNYSASYIALPFPTCMHTSHITIYSLIPRSSPPPTVACKTTGEERLEKRLCTISNATVHEAI